MARVPVLDQQVREVGLPGARVNANATAESFGAGEAQNIEKAGWATMGIGLELEKKAEEANARDAVNKAQQDVNNIFFGQMVQRKGLDAATPEEAMQTFKEVGKKYKDNLSGPLANSLFDASFNAHLTESMKSVAHYRASQIEDFDRQTVDANSKTAVDTAILNRNNPEVIAQSAKDVADNTAYQYRGMGQDVISEKQKEATSHVYEQVFEAHKAESPRLALEFLKANADNFDPEKRTRMEKEIRPYVDNEAALTAAQAFDNTPVDVAQKKIDGLVRAGTLSPEAGEKTIAQVLYRRNVREKAEQDKTAAMYNQVAQTVIKDPTTELPVTLPPTVYEQAFNLQRKLQKSERTYTDPAVLQDVLNMPQEQFANVNLLDDKYQNGLSSNKLQEMIATQAKIRKGEDAFPQVQTVNTFGMKLAEEIAGKKDIPKQEFILQEFQNRLATYPKEKQNSIETMNKVRDEMLLQGHTYGGPIDLIINQLPFTGNTQVGAAYKAKLGNDKIFMPDTVPANVPKEATFTQKAIKNGTVSGWEYTNPNGVKKFWDITGKEFNVITPTKVVRTK
jgi:hypothetical protein